MADCVDIPYNPALDECPDVVEETRVGYGFANPDLNSDIVVPGWGQMVTADELRYVDLMGTKLVSPADAQTVDDNTLRFYVLQAISYVEQRLQLDIIPRQVRYVIEGTDRELPLPAGDPKNWIDPESRLIRESAYPLKVTAQKYWNTLETNRRPIIRNDALNVVFIDIDRHVATEVPAQMVRLNGDGLYGQIQIVPNWFLGAGYSSGYGGFYGGNRFGRNLTDDLPGTIGIDYDTGYSRAGLVPADLRELIRKLSAWNLYQNFGTAKSPGIASASVSLNSISESYATTSTSTSSIFGAEMGRVEKWLEGWWKSNEFRYRDAFLGSW